MTHIPVKNIRIEEFDYPLPDERIARHPLAERDSCKLLTVTPIGTVEHHTFSSLPEILPSGSVLVCNDTRVINARISFRKSTGSKIEVFLLEPVAPIDYVLMFQTRGECKWNCLIGNLKRWKAEPLVKELRIDGKPVVLKARKVESAPGSAQLVEFTWDDPSFTFASVVDAAGFIPIPPYLKRESESTDADDYQTVYARFKGSVAAPTAGLHFTPQLFDRIREKGIKVSPLTLHVGAGTFQPVKSEEIGGHQMHTETFSVTRDLIDTLIEAKSEGKPITAVGTTSVRTLESLPYLGAAIAATGEIEEVKQWWPYGSECPCPVSDTVTSLKAIRRYMEERGLPSITASTSIMIAPGFEWRIVDNIVTNFHQPESTLLLLVSSFLDRIPGKAMREESYREEDVMCNEDSGNGSVVSWREIYDIALASDYRFLSYGDACLFLTNVSTVEADARGCVPA